MTDTWPLGWSVGLGVIAATGVSSGVLGFTVTTIITSFPELVSLVTAVRVGALTLGVSTIIGGNAFDALQISLADRPTPAGRSIRRPGRRAWSCSAGPSWSRPCSRPA